MKTLSFIAGVLIATFCLSACASSITSRLYDDVLRSKGKDMATGFVALSHMFLTEKELDVIERDYLSESNTIKKYYYEYLLSKRTQEAKYHKRFIASSSNNMSLLKSNTTDWASISSPFYVHLAYFARFDTSALEIVLKLSRMTDGAILSTIATDLAEVQNINPEMFETTARRLGFTKQELNNLMEDE